MIFISKSDISRKKDLLLELFTDESIPELEKFVKLGLNSAKFIKLNGEESLTAKRR